MNIPSIQSRGVMFDRILAAIALVAISPVLIVIGLAILIEDGRPIFFRQRRVGRSGKLFSLLKFRSMRVGMPGASITAGSDPRITRLGNILRKYKLDELPQLWNVVKGEMRMVGPRPEVPNFVDLQNPVWRGVLQVSPGITDLASLIYRNEEEVLKAAPDTERYYRETVQPNKLALNLHYIRTRTMSSDFRLILLTVRYSLAPKQFNADRIARSFLGEKAL